MTAILNWITPNFLRSSHKVSIWDFRNRMNLIQRGLKKIIPNYQDYGVSCNMTKMQGWYHINSPLVGVDLMILLLDIYSRTTNEKDVDNQAEP
jgi:hypothetical protein